MYFFQDDIGILIQLNSLPFFSYILTPWSAYFLPLFRLITYIEYLSFGLRFIPYVFVTIMFHIITTILAGYIVFELTKNKTASILAILSFSINVTYTEPLLWLTIQTLPLATGCIGLAFLFWNRFLNSGKQRYFYLNIIFSCIAGLLFQIGIAVSFIFLLTSVFLRNKTSVLNARKNMTALLIFSVFSYAIGPIVSFGKIGKSIPEFQNGITDIFQFGAFVISGVARGVIGRFFLPGFDPSHTQILPTIISFLPFFLFSIGLFLFIRDKQNTKISPIIKTLILFIWYPYIWAGLLRYQFGLKQALAQRYAYPSEFFFIILLYVILDKANFLKSKVYSKVIITIVVLLSMSHLYTFMRAAQEFEIIPLKTKSYFEEVETKLKSLPIILDIAIPKYMHQDFTLSQLYPVLFSKRPEFVNPLLFECTTAMKKSLQNEKVFTFYTLHLQENNDNELILQRLNSCRQNELRFE